jgi:uncharacterized protein (TIGR01777 family)
VRVAISGSSGLIGTALIESLRTDGHDVSRISRDRSDPSELEGADAVVNLAGAGIGDRRWTAARKREIRDSRTQGTAALVDALGRLDRKPSVLVSASAIGYYGDRGDEVLTEASRAGAGFLPEVARDWEVAARRAEDVGIRTVMIRTGIVLAAHGGALKRMLPLFRSGLGGRMGAGRQWWSWITLADEVAAIRWLIDRDDVHGPVNVTAPNPVTNTDFTRALGRAVSRPTILAVPRFALGLVLGRELADHLLFGSLRVVPSVLAERGFEFAHPTIDEALRAVVST